MRGERSVEVKVTTVPQGKIQVTTQTSNEVFCEVFANKKTALKDRENLKLLYGIHTMVFAFGGIGGFIAFMDLAIKTHGDHLNFEKVGAGAIVAIFTILSAKAARRNIDKMEILREQISAIKRS